MRPLVGNQKKLDNFNQIFLNAQSSSFFIHDRENNKTIFIYLYFSFELENRKEQIVVLWLGRVPRDKPGMVNCHSFVG
jgi:hypothetical protein